MRTPSLAPLILVALVLITFGRLANCDFTTWDDRQTVVLNPSLNPPTAEKLAAFWSPAHAQMDLYAPMTYTAWSAVAGVAPRHARDREGATLSPGVFHLANVLLHACSAVVVWLILRRLVKDDLAALAGTAIFAVHPMQTEAVAWVSGLKDVLSGMLSLLAIWMYLNFARDEARGWKRIAWYVIATVGFAGAMLAKPQAVAAPVVMLVIDWMILGQPMRRVVMRLVPWFVLCLPVILIGRHLQPACLLDSPVMFRPIIAADALAFYLTKIAWPHPLMVDYGRSIDWLIASPQRLFTWLVPTVLLLICIAIRKRVHWALAAMALFIAALLPVLGLVKFDYQTYSTVADHYVYLAMLAPAFALAAALAKLQPKKWIAPVALATLIYAGLSIRQGLFWQNTVTLFDHNAESNPTSMAAAGTLGVYWSEHGNPTRALQLLSQSAAEHPNVPLTHYTYANVLLGQDQFDKAVEEFRRAIALDPGKPKYYTNFGVALAKSGHTQEALDAFSTGARLDPNDPDNFQNAGITLLNMGKDEEARKALGHAFELDQSRTQVLNLLIRLSKPKSAAASRPE